MLGDLDGQIPDMDSVDNLSTREGKVIIKSIGILVLGFIGVSSVIQGHIDHLTVVVGAILLIAIPDVMAEYNIGPFSS